MKRNINSIRGAEALLIAGIVFVALNLRPALVSVGPLVGLIRESTGLSNSMLGLLTSLPLIAFGVVSNFTSLFTKRFGISGTLAGALVLLAIGVIIRSLPSIAALYIGTALLGVAIALGNVLIPGLVKRNLPHKSGKITSLYSSVLGMGAALAAGISLPLAVDLDLGWRGSLGVWAVLAIVGFFVWLPQLWRIKKSNNDRSFRVAMKNLGGSKLAWKVALFMGLQSFAFYVILAWLPEIIQSRGFDSTYAGWMLSLSQATGVLGSLLVPTLAGKRKNQRGMVLFLGIVETVSLIGLMLPQIGMTPVWVSLIGFALGGTFSLALLFIVLRTNDSETATELSGMAQSIGYFIAAIGPVVFGSIFDFTGSWLYPLGLLFAIGFLKFYMGLGAAKDEKLEFKNG
ncbi:CynX/NimT family MFS transporter [Cryomorpha ignava]|uniref:CynX/NimT family MFS transporter n=1 Tax=Cryomorpha ignava TaxID=101383 RepID=UPI00293C0D0A|nr:MFS transporter [Cryomorpha ignava]